MIWQNCFSALNLMNSQQTIPWKTRADLQSVEHASAAAAGFTVKDPVKDEFYFFSQIEMFFLVHLRTPQSIGSLIEMGLVELGCKFGVREIQNYLKHLARDNLIVPQVFGDADRLFQQQKIEQRGRWQQRILGFLSIKVGGFHPVVVLNLLRPFGWLCFNSISLLLYGGVVLATAAFAILSIDTLWSQIPSMAELTTPGMVVSVLIGFYVAKILHELGHAIACQYTRHECSEMGLLLLVFLPCLYCDVSDMWSEPQRWKRVLVTMAGVWVELGIAVICFWIWYTTVPGPLHTFTYSLMLITSVNTLLINGNPLMRYDGYYALSDLVRIPNLGSISRQQLRDRLNRFFWAHESFVRQSRLSGALVIYEICAMVYRVLILAAISIGAWKFFDYQQLRSIGNGVVGMVLFTAAVPLLLAVVHRVRTMRPWDGRLSNLRWFNTLMFGGLMFAIGYLAWGAEFSHRVWGTVQIQLADPHNMFAPANGKFFAQAKDGQLVEAGDLIGSIENPELALEQLTLAGQLAETQLNLNLIRLTSDAVSLAGKTEFWKQRESTLTKQLEENRTKQTELEVRATRAGRIVAFNYDANSPEAQSLGQKVGSLLDAKNKNCQVNRGDPICYVGTPTRLRGLLSVDQKDIELIAIGQLVKIALPFEADTHEGTVVEISLDHDDTAANNSNQSSQPGSGGDMNQVSYQIEIDLEAEAKLRVGSLHPAVILCRKTNVVGVVNRWVRNSFWF